MTKKSCGDTLVCACVCVCECVSVQMSRCSDHVQCLVTALQFFPSNRRTKWRLVLAAGIRTFQSFKSTDSLAHKCVWKSSFPVSYWIKRAIPDGFSPSPYRRFFIINSGVRVGRRPHFPFPRSKLSLCCSSRLFPHYIRPLHRRFSSLRHHMTPPTRKKDVTPDNIAP